MSLAIARLILQTQEVYKEFLEFYPILLLDDIAAELDIENSKKIFKEKILKKQQTFIATIDKGQIPKNVLKVCQEIEL